MKQQIRLTKAIGKTAAGSVISVSRRDARVFIALNKAVMFEETQVAIPEPEIIKQPEPEPVPEPARPVRRSNRISAAALPAAPVAEPDASVHAADTGTDSAPAE